MRAGATVYVYGAQGFRTVHAGTNGFTWLLNRDAFFYGRAAFKPICWDAEGATSYVPVMRRVAELLAGDIEVDRATGTIITQAFPGHHMIYAPGCRARTIAIHARPPPPIAACRSFSVPARAAQSSAL